MCVCLWILLFQLVTYLLVTLPMLVTLLNVSQTPLSMLVTYSNVSHTLLC